MLLSRLVLTSNAVAATRARLQKAALLAECLAEAAQDEIEITVGYLSGETGQRRIGVAYATLQAVTARHADHATLTLHDVDAALRKLVETQGAGSTERRMRVLAELFGRATDHEQAFLRGLLTGELRQGALEGVMLDAIAVASGVPLAALRRAAMLSGQLGHVASVACTQGETGLSAFRLQLFRPLLPMLAQPADDVADVFSQLKAPVLEWKLDGARIQVHRHDDEVRVYSRQLNDVSRAVPEIVEQVLTLPARSLVLDGEAIALREDRRPHAFQTTMRRFGRRLDVPALRSELPLSAFFFDLLHRDGVDLLDLSYTERVRTLVEVVPEGLRVTRTMPDSVSSAERFVEQALSHGHEGVVAKDPDAPYEAGRRGAAWLKLKRAHTLDLVVLAAEWGSGRRRGYLSNLHLGARANDAGDGFVMLGKTFKGMTDEILAWQTQELLARETHRDAMTVYVRPELVVEVAFDGVQSSTTYSGGVALRFARIKGYRADKTAADADTLEAVRRFHAA